MCLRFKNNHQVLIGRFYTKNNEVDEIVKVIDFDNNKKQGLRVIYKLMKNNEIRNSSLWDFKYKYTSEVCGGEYVSQINVPEFVVKEYLELYRGCDSEGYNNIVNFYRLLSLFFNLPKNLQAIYREDIESLAEDYKDSDIRTLEDFL